MRLCAKAVYKVTAGRQKRVGVRWVWVAGGIRRDQLRYHRGVLEMNAPTPRLTFCGDGSFLNASDTPVR